MRWLFKFKKADIYFEYMIVWSFEINYGFYKFSVREKREIFQ